MNKYKPSIALLMIFVLLSAGLMIACTQSKPGNKALAPLAQVCQGQGVEQTTAYTGGPPHKIALMNYSGTTNSWMKNMPDNWCPSSINDVQLVLVIKEETEELIETCKYQTGPNVQRYRYSIDAELREAKTGTMISQTTIYGEPPRQCEFREDFSLTRLKGSHISFYNLQRWLELYVMDIKEVETPAAQAILTLAVVAPNWSPIKTLNDLDKKNVAFSSAEPEQCTSGLVRDIGCNMLAPYALEYNPMLLPSSEVLRVIEVGIIDCAFIWAKHPWQPLQNSKYECRFLSFSADARVLASDCWDFVEPAAIPANTYQNQTQDIMTIGIYK